MAAHAAMSPWRRMIIICETLILTEERLHVCATEDGLCRHFSVVCFSDAVRRIAVPRTPSELLRIHSKDQTSMQIQHSSAPECATSSDLRPSRLRSMTVFMRAADDEKRIFFATLRPSASSGNIFSCLLHALRDISVPTAPPPDISAAEGNALVRVRPVVQVQYLQHGESEYGTMLCRIITTLMRTQPLPVRMLV